MPPGAGGVTTMAIMGRRASWFLGPEGPLPQRLDHYEQRAGQLETADAIERALDEDRVLICEAATGTGKTLAYLIPALRAGRRVVIATATRALQEQLVRRDVPLALDLVERPVRVEVVKGLGNYICRRRLTEAQAAASGDAWEEGLFAALELVERSATGDIAESEALAEDHPIWPRVVATRETRIGSRCEFYDTCYVTRLKERAARADLLIVNHHLLFADLALRGDHPGSVLPDYDAVVIDEAHRIEAVASQFFGLRIDAPRVHRLAADLRRRGPPEVDNLADQLEREAQALFGLVNLALGGADRAALSPDWRGASGVLRHYHALDTVLEGAEHALDDAPATAGPARRGLAGLRADLERLFEPDGSLFAYAVRRGSSLGLHASPVDVGPALRTRLFDQGRAVVMVSATLAVEGSFSFIRQRFGLDEPLSMAPVDELCVPSPFHHRRQALLYLPPHLPSVDDDHFAGSAAEEIATLHRTNPGGTLVLCTSNRNVQRFAAALSAHAPLVQGTAPKTALLDTFRRRPGGLLIATQSFWEGVDIPGRALSLVVIDRLPFDVPTDPLIVARHRRLEARRISPFAHDTLPRAALTLKQGYGRLIRAATDRGVVAILDRRITERRYGDRLLRSLPDAGRTRDRGDVVAFWASLDEEPPD